LCPWRRCSLKKGQEKNVVEQARPPKNKKNSIIRVQVLVGVLQELGDTQLRFGVVVAEYPVKQTPATLVAGELVAGQVALATLLSAGHWLRVQGIPVIELH